ncbi:hypothetical protein [Pseudoneobacillus sp. C159]
MLCLATKSELIVQDSDEGHTDHNSIKESVQIFKSGAGDEQQEHSGHNDIHKDSGEEHSNGVHSEGGHEEENGGHHGPVVETPPNDKILGTYGAVNLSFILIGVWNKWFRRRGDI